MSNGFLHRYGSKLIENEYQIVPIKPNTKHPGFPNWQNVEADGKLLYQWLNNGHAKSGVGILTKFTPAVDLDINDPDIAAQMIHYVTNHFGNAPKRIGQSPKILLMFKTDTPFRKLTSNTYVDALDYTHKVEILANGQQFVAFAIHPDTKEPYRWVDQDPTKLAYHDLPTLTAEQGKQIIEYFESIVPDDWTLKERGQTDAINVDLLDPISALENAKPPLGLTSQQIIRILDKLDPATLSDQRWFTVVAALHHQYRGSQEGWEILDNWSKQDPQRYNQKENYVRWLSVKDSLNRNNITFATIIDWVKQLKKEQAQTLNDTFDAETSDINSDAQNNNVELNDRNLPKTKFQFTSINTLLQNFGPIDWRIRNYLEANTLGFLFGDPGSFKSFLALDMAAHIALGKPWHDNPVDQGLVIYIAGEGHGGFSRRLMAWQTEHESLHNAPFVFSEHAAQFYDLDAAIEVKTAVDQIAKFHKQKPKLIVIDTLARNFGPGNENDTSDAGVFIEHVDKILRKRYQATVLIVHHTGHSDKERGRGAMAFKAAADFEYRMQREELELSDDGPTQLVGMICTKMKDARPPQPLIFQCTPTVISQHAVEIAIGVDRAKEVMEEMSIDDLTGVVLKPWQQPADGFQAVNLEGAQLATFEFVMRVLKDEKKPIRTRVLSKMLVGEGICNSPNGGRKRLQRLIDDGYLTRDGEFIDVNIDSPNVKAIELDFIKE